MFANQNFATPNTESPASSPELENVLMLESQEKKAILQKVHEEFSGNIVRTLLILQQHNEKNIDAKKIIKSSQALSDLHENLTGFEALSNVIKKKALIRPVIESYIQQLLAGFALSHKEGFQSFVSNAKANWSANMVLDVFNKQLKTSASYPSLLELPECNNRLRDDMRGIDIFLHLNQNILDEYAQIRNAKDAMIESLSKINIQATNHQSQNKAPQKPETKPKAPETNYRNNPFCFMPNTNSSKSENILSFEELMRMADAMKVKPEKVKIYAEQMQKYKTDLIAKHKKSLNPLFHNIAINAPLDEIKKAITADSKNIKDSNGNSALHLAAICGNLAAVKLLLNTGFSLTDKNYNNNGHEAKNKEGNTPLHLAVLTHNTDLSFILLNAGASKDTTNNEGYSVNDFSKLLEDENKKTPYRRNL